MGKTKNKNKRRCESGKEKVKYIRRLKNTMSNSHLRFVARTIIVHKNEIEPAYRMLDKILKREGFFADVKRNYFYEKPYAKRNRLCYERQKRIYDSEMQRKIKFVMRKNRP